MKFGELRKACRATVYRLVIVSKGGKRRTEEINMVYTVEPRRKLEKWDGAEVAAFGPTITKWPHGYVNTLEVELNA